MTLTDTTLLGQHDALLLDLDGVVYVGPDPVDHAVEVLDSVRRAGLATAYVTNNASRPPHVVAEQLRSFGLEVDDDDVVTSAQAGARVVADRVPPGSAVLAVGGPGVRAALEARGLRPVASSEDEPAAVLMGFGMHVGWADLAEASYAVGSGALFVATNTDTSIPTPRGLAPGNGTLVAAVVAATGVSPVVCGKPYLPLMTESVERVGALRPLMVGDRLDTDIEAAERAGVPSLLVLTGVTDVAALVAAPPGRRPTYVSADLRGLLESPAALAVASGASGDRLDALREACRSAWASKDAGRAVPLDAGLMASLSADVAAALRA